MILALVIAVEVVSVIMMMTRWTRRYLSGAYADTAPAETFLTHLTAGLVPIFAVAFLLGEHLHKQDKLREQRENELATIERDVLRLIKK